MNEQNQKKDAFIRDLYIQFRQEFCHYLTDKYRMDASDAEDTVHSAFMRFSEQESVFTIKNPRAFLYKTCNNIAIDKTRHNAVQHKFVQAAANDDSEVCSIGPERTVASHQRLNLLTKALWGMPGRRRKLLLMSRFEGLSYAEIARRIGISEAAVRKHISKALMDCRSILKDQYE